MPYLSITRAVLALLTLLHPAAVLGVVLVDLGAELARREQQQHRPSRDAGA